MAYTTINKSSDHFVAKSYTGNGGTTNVTGMNFQPDFSWLKCKSIAYNHALFDSLRGASQRLATNLTSAQVNASGEGITSFNSDGYTVVQGTTLEYGNNGVGYASWNFKGGGSGSSNSDGSVTASLSANATAGFSISTFTTPSSGTFTVGHGLGVPPQFIIYRPVTASGWQIGHDSVGWTYFLTFSTAAPASSTAFGNTAPTNDVWTGNTANVGGGASCIAYCFAEKPGYSRIAQFKGNSNHNFHYTGFAPKFIIAKTNATDWWSIQDNDNVNNDGSCQLLFPESAGTQSTGVSTRLLSNGFYVDTTNTGFNNSSYVTSYLAIGQSIVGTNNKPTTGRI
tara:strand:- start:208 stop:1224 length:1017 start_codon:yes stop_codon:yes gene_type:complete